ncbi:MAG: carbamoyl-phosphate synthase small subunit [Porticoccaceae bacterium]|jgi:cell division protein FtsN|nr:carbamoyl-phosphate synthase small subunit [Porticoccaceae bacterium]
MARDYAKPSLPKRKRAVRNQRKPQRPTPPAWALLGGGFAAGLAAGLLVALLWRPQADTAPPQAGQEQPEPPAEAGADAKPRFDFYTLLKESEVFVPEGEEPEIAPAPAPPPAQPEAQAQPTEAAPAAAEPEFQFILQAGSFRSRADADSLRARLLLLNLSASVESAGARPGEVWHRVMVGPFDSQENLARARAALQQNGIDNILVKRKRN